jgi:hypothetical protein
MALRVDAFAWVQMPTSFDFGCFALSVESFQEWTFQKIGLAIIEIHPPILSISHCLPVGWDV